MADQIPKKTPPRGDRTGESNDYSYLISHYVEPGEIPVLSFAVQSGYGTSLYTNASHNPIVSRALNLVESAVFWPYSSIKSKNDYELYPEYEEIDNEVIDFCTKQLKYVGIDKKLPPLANQRANFVSVLRSMLHDGRVYGFAIAEPAWVKENGQNRLKKIDVKPPFNFDFVKVPRTDDLDYVTGGGALGPLKPEELLIGTWPTLKWGQYYGESDLHDLIVDITVVDRLLRIMLEGGSASAFKTLLVWISNNTGISKEEVQKIKDAFKNTKYGGMITLPMVEDEKGEPKKAVEAEILEDRVNPDTIEALWPIINELIKGINRGLGVPDELGQVTVAAGSWAKSKTQFDLFMATVERATKWVEDLANKIVHSIIYYNYVNLPEDYCLPEWSFDSIEEDADLTLAKYYELLTKNKIVDPREPWIREKLDLPPLSDEYKDDLDEDQSEPEQNMPQLNEYEDEDDSADQNQQDDNGTGEGYVAKSNKEFKKLQREQKRNSKALEKIERKLSKRIKEIEHYASNKSDRSEAI